jgi:tripartite-type tricarboxylate transporter receptor subunit TctC
MNMRQLKSMARAVATALTAGLVALAAQPALSWTDRPVKMLVPAPAGGTMDVVARLLAEQLSGELGQPVVVDNKPGAGGAIAVQAMLAAPADGQTIMVTASNVLTEIPHVMKTSFDPLKDLRPIAAIARSTLVLVAAPGFAPQDLKAVVAHVKANAGKVSFASYSTGTASHYAGMILNQKAGLDLLHVPFAGSPPALQQVMGGQIPLMFDGMVTSLPLVNGGKLKAYAVASKARSPYMPQVPTFAELGFPDMDFSNWIGVVTAGQLSAELAEKINQAVAKSAASPKLRERLVAAGFEVGATQRSVELAQAVRAESERNAGIVKTFNIQLTQ